MSRSRQAQLEKRVALEPKGWSTLLNITPSQWQKYWKSLVKAKTTYPADFEETHRFTLGHRNHYPTNDNSCPFCAKEYSHEYFLHIYQECEISRSIWNKMNLKISLSWKNLIANAFHTITTMQQIEGYLKIIWNLFLRRIHFDHTEPIDDQSLKKLIALISLEQKLKMV